MGGYEANSDDILRANDHVARAIRRAKFMVTDFVGDLADSGQWWGKEDGTDGLAKELGTTCRYEEESAINMIGAITSVFLALIDAIAEQATAVGKPQKEALDSIDSASTGGEGGAKR